MSHFDRLLNRGLDHLAGSLAATHGPDDADEVAGLVGDLSFPALLGLLGVPQSGPPAEGPELVERAVPAVAEALAGEGATAPAVRPRVEQLVSGQGVPEDGEPGLRDKILEKAAEQLAEQLGVPVTPEQARRIARLLASGEFFRDVHESTAAIALLVPGLPVALQRDVGLLPSRILRLGIALGRDLVGTPAEAEQVLRDLSDGRLDEAPVVLSRTFRALYGFASLRTTAETIRDLIGPENESVRLAIVIYARANGIPIEEQDLTVLASSVFDPDAPDMGPALVRAVERLGRTSTLDEVKRVLGRLGRAEA